MKARVIYGRTNKYFVEGKEVTKEEFDEVVTQKPFIPGKPPRASSLTAWPMTSAGAGVHPEQIDEAEATNKRMGDNVRYVREGENAGDAIFTDRGQRRDHLKNIRLFDKDGGYGD